MKYNLVVSRTYVTEIEVTANNIQEAWQWVSENNDIIYEQELEQCNVVSEMTDMKEIGPSENEAEELLDLAGHITDYLHRYRHVGDYIPSEMFEELEKMRSHIYNED